MLRWCTLIFPLIRLKCLIHALVLIFYREKSLISRLNDVIGIPLLDGKGGANPVHPIVDTKDAFVNNNILEFSVI